MAISRAQLVKELEPGLNALFGLEYKNYANEHAEIFNSENSDRAFEEEVMLSGFGNATVKPEGGSVNYDAAQETFTARYTHETLALAFSITEEAIEDNLYDRLASRYTKALARSMANSKQVKAANVLNRAFNSSYTGGDGLELELGAVGAVQMLGAFNGCFYTDPTTNKPTWKAYYPGSITASDIVANVYADPQVIYEGQHDGTATVANNNHANHDHVGTGGSTTTGQSSAEIDSSTYTTTATGTWTQIGTSKDPDNSDLTAANSNAYIVANTGEHAYKLITGL